MLIKSNLYLGTPAPTGTDEDSTNADGTKKNRRLNELTGNYMDYFVADQVYTTEVCRRKCHQSTMYDSVDWRVNTNYKAINNYQQTYINLYSSQGYLALHNT